MNNEQEDEMPENNQEDENQTSASEFSEEEELNYEAFSDNIDPIASQDTKKSSAPANELNEDQIRIKSLEEELAKMKDLMMRTVAEAENGRKRALRERENAGKFAISSFARDILSVSDNLRRALESITAELLEQDPAIKNLNSGIEATERELLRCFEKNGIKKTIPIDQKFDPNFHEVMFEAPMPDKPNGSIIQVIEPGYIINGRILRPARVGVAKNDGDTAGSPHQEPGQNIDTQA